MHESCAADARDGGAQAGDTRPLRGGPLTDMEREQNGAHKAKPTEPRARDMLACPLHPEEKLGASEANRARNSRRQDVAEFWLEHGPRAHEYGRRCLHRWQGRRTGSPGSRRGQRLGQLSQCEMSTVHCTVPPGSHSFHRVLRCVSKPIDIESIGTTQFFTEHHVMEHHGPSGFDTVKSCKPAGDYQS